MYDGVFDLHGKSVMTSVVDSSISHNRRDRSWGLIIARVGKEQHGKFNSNAEYLSFLGWYDRVYNRACSAIQKFRNQEHVSTHLAVCLRQM